MPRNFNVAAIDIVDPTSGFASVQDAGQLHYDASLILDSGEFMSCANHDHCIDDALARAEAICARSGARLTPIRRDVLREVWSSHEATKAYDLIERLSRHGEQVKPPTVYRALDFLLEQGLIHRIESLNAFVGCEHPQEPHQAILMICDRCGDIREEDDPAVHAALSDLANQTGFTPRSAVIELRGLCRVCRTAH